MLHFFGDINDFPNLQKQLINPITMEGKGVFPPPSLWFFRSNLKLPPSLFEINTPIGIGLRSKEFTSVELPEKV